MGMFSESFNSFDDLFTHQLKDVYDAEHQLTRRCLRWQARPSRRS
jgi:ferritin-like metal-binding protein YciE